MDDLISRQAAIDVLDKRFNDVPMKLTTEILQLRRDLRELPPAQPEWIPCSEKLPEVGTVCLACGRNRGIYVARLDYDVNRYYWTWLGVTREVKPIAWMPLPEPYTERREE